MYLIIFIKICILMEIVLSKNKKLPYQLAQIGENYMDYKKKNLSADEVKMTIRDFYNTLYNVQFIQLPYFGPYNYDYYVKRIKKFCKKRYETYPVFIVNNTVNEFVTHLNDLVTNIHKMNLKEIMSDGDANTNPKSYHNILVNCFNKWDRRGYSDIKYLKNVLNCVDNMLSKIGKLVEFQKHIERFKNSIREISLINDDRGLQFDYKMLPILRYLLINEYKPFDEKVAKVFYIEYLGVDMKMIESKEECMQNYKALDKNTYTSIKIGYHIFPAKDDTTFEVFKLRRINFIFHLRALFKDMGIPNDELFNSLQNASNQSIDKSYYDSVVNTRVMVNERYESYIIRMKAKEYYPLPMKLWKLDVANIPNGQIQNN